MFSEADRAMMGIEQPPVASPPTEAESPLAGPEKYKALNDYYNDVFVDMRGSLQMMEHARQNNRLFTGESAADVIHRVTQKAEADPGFRQESIAYLKDEMTRPYFPKYAEMILRALDAPDREAPRSRRTESAA